MADPFVALLFFAAAKGFVQWDGLATPAGIAALPVGLAAATRYRQAVVDHAWASAVGSKEAFAALAASVSLKSSGFTAKDMVDSEARWYLAFARDKLGI